MTSQKTSTASGNSDEHRVGPWTWIPAKDVLPMGPHDVLCTDLEGVWIGCYCMGEWCRDDYPVDVVVTHWQELPEPPEQ